MTITIDDVYVPARPGPWREFIVAAVNNGIPQPPATACGTTECGHAVGSYHYLLLALDRGACIAHAEALWDLFVPYAQGPDRVIDELFLDCRGGYKRGVSIGPIGGHACCDSGDPNAHLHVALRPGFHLPDHLLYPEEGEIMGAVDDINGHTSSTGYAVSLRTIKEARTTRQTVRNQVDEVLAVLEQMAADDDRILANVRRMRRELREANEGEPTDTAIEKQLKAEFAEPKGN